MQLIRKLGRRKNKTGNNYVSWGLFKCGIAICGKEVERPLGNGKKAKSCGCDRYNFTEEHKQNIAKALKGKNKSEEHKQKISKTRIEKGLAKGENNPLYGKHQTKETKQKLRDKAIERYKNSENHPMFGKSQTEETRQKMREAKIGKNAGEKNYFYGKKFIGKDNHQWQDGKSFEPYNPEFNKELKQQILERDNYICQCPNCEDIINILHIHHIDYDKKNSNPKNLIVLCRKCHMKTFGKNNRIYWIEYYQNIMKDRFS